MKTETYKVLDLTYHFDEGQECFLGTYQECLDFIAKQNTTGLKIIKNL